MIYNKKKCDSGECLKKYIDVDELHLKKGFIETFFSPCACHFLDEDSCFLREYWEQMNWNELES